MSHYGVDLDIALRHWLIAILTRLLPLNALLRHMITCGDLVPYQVTPHYPPYPLPHYPRPPFPHYPRSPLPPAPITPFPHFKYSKLSTPPPGLRTLFVSVGRRVLRVPFCPRETRPPPSVRLPPREI